MSATTFSYAQAARGQVASQPSPQQASSPAPSTAGSHGKDDASTGATSVTAPSVVSNGTEPHDTEQSIAGHVDAASSRQDSETSSVVGAGSSTASVAEQSGKVTQEHSTKTTDAQPQSQSEDKGPHYTSRTSRPNEGTDGRRGRKGKKGRSTDKDAQSDQAQEEDSEKVKEPPKPIVLTEATPPAVNPWAKRMEAHKAAVIIKPASPTGSAAVNELKQGPSQEDAGAPAPQKKAVEVSRPADQAARRGGPRGSRASDRDEKSSASLPPVADPSSWPDPKSAAVREQPARKSHEKTDSIEKEGQDEAGPTRKKTWEKLEIVHSVVFETQLPQLRGSKPRGGARGGREAGSTRGGHPSANGAPASASTAAAQPASSSASDKAPSPIGGSAGPRTTSTRPREGSVPSRSTSQPQAAHPSKRASIDGASRDQRKASVPGSTSEQGRDASAETSSVSP